MASPLAKRLFGIDGVSHAAACCARVRLVICDNCSAAQLFDLASECGMRISMARKSIQAQ